MSPGGLHIRGSWPFLPYMTPMEDPMSFKVDVIVFTNPTDVTIKLDALGLDPVGPKQDVEIPLHLAAPTRADNGVRAKSPVEQVAPQLYPKDPEERKAWMDVPPPAVPQSKIVSIAARPAQEAPGVKALREKREAELKRQTAAQNATALPKTNVSPQPVKQ